MEVRVGDTGDSQVLMQRVDGPNRSILVVAPGVMSAALVAMLGAFLAGAHYDGQCTGSHRRGVSAAQKVRDGALDDVAGGQA
jgi:hypothetical protein